LWCHELSSTGDYKIRDCERCHGPDSLHNIQVDSTNADNIGTIVIGGEDAGYGHVGRDAGPGDSDCWGCHGFSSAPLPDPGDYPDDHPSYYEAPYDTEADCRVCHDFYVPDRHHVLYGNAFPSLTNAPYWTPGDVIYVCLSCHGPSLTLVRDCLVCHNNDDDSDGDGLTDGKERSIGTDPSDTDSDDDEIIDGLDTCPLDALNDADGDGVCGDVDICPGFDDTIDADGDSVPDGCDACPLDNPDDSDSDGVCDSADVCPGFDDTIDGDGDSVPDGCDICPGGDDNIDTDSDAIPDFCDICPNDDLNDADGDGVCGDVDACPSEDATGFDIDSDGCLDDFGGLTDDINSLITSGVIDQNLADPLIKKVTNAEKSELKNNICAAVNQLEAFQNQIEDKRENPLSNEEADQLINYAENVIFQLLAKLPEGESCH
jgi:hypothetical protein